MEVRKFVTLMLVGSLVGYYVGLPPMVLAQSFDPTGSTSTAGIIPVGDQTSGSEQQQMDQMRVMQLAIENNHIIPDTVVNPTQGAEHIIPDTVVNPTRGNPEVLQEGPVSNRGPEPVVKPPPYVPPSIDPIPLPRQRPPGPPLPDPRREQPSEQAAGPDLNQKTNPNPDLGKVGQIHAIGSENNAPVVTGIAPRTSVGQTTTASPNAHLDNNSQVQNLAGGTQKTTDQAVQDALQNIIKKFEADLQIIIDDLKARLESIVQNSGQTRSPKITSENTPAKLAKVEVQKNNQGATPKDKDGPRNQGSNKSWIGGNTPAGQAMIQMFMLLQRTLTAALNAVLTTIAALISGVVAIFTNPLVMSQIWQGLINAINLIWSNFFHDMAIIWQNFMSQIHP